MPSRLPTPGWTVQDSLELYNVPLWSAGYFSVNGQGNVVVRPRRGKGQELDLNVLVEDLKARGYGLPLLIRFTDVLRERVREISGCFAKAMREYEYGGSYQAVYPIKVNQQCHVVQELLAHGIEHNLGLEIGSKPELLVALALLDDPDAILVCNGYKDDAYVETALLAQKLGRRPILVIDRVRDLEPILRVARKRGIRPRLGIRAKLSARGAGRWAESGGSRSKFGLTPTEIVAVVERLRGEGLVDCLELLHFHMGSQVPSIRIFKNALSEASRIFAELHDLGANMRYFDVGGGLAVDYDGSNTDFHSSMNYSIQEYANDVVSGVMEACDARELPHPIIVTESGRALVAHHAVLVFDVLDTAEVTEPERPEAPAETEPNVVQELYEVWTSISRRKLLEPYHDALACREQATQLFNLGYLDLAGRARAEKLFYACLTRLRRFARELDRVPEELESLEKDLADTYYCNFSVFQSLPDSWAVGQLFPVMPIHRLDEQPMRRGTLADLTCDSDGKIDSFIDVHDVRRALDLHAVNGSPYYLGAFLVGAYQEILGDLHNLFGDTNAIHVSLLDGRYRIDHVQCGDTVSEVLSYVEFDKRHLLTRVREAGEQALWNDRISAEEMARLLKRYEDGLNSYTYLADVDNGVRPAPTPAPIAAPTRRNGS